jgi:hypothetical protein
MEDTGTRSEQYHLPLIKPRCTSVQFNLKVIDEGSTLQNCQSKRPVMCCKSKRHARLHSMYLQKGIMCSPEMSTKVN